MQSNPWEISQLIMALLIHKTRVSESRIEVFRFQKSRIQVFSRLNTVQKIRFNPMEFANALDLVVVL